jgi:hypothetical protein
MSEPTKPAPPKRKHHWFQFSLRSLFVAMTILAVQCAVCFPMLRAYEVNCELEEAMRQSKCFSGWPTPDPTSAQAMIRLAPPGPRGG